MSNENFWLRQDGWLKGKLNGASKLPRGGWYTYCKEKCDCE